MKRGGESGFAMLFVFLMAASIATMLYMQLPRAAFEAQRGKEELLQHRGEEYIRAIQLYVTKWRRYPQSLDDLERTNNIRYLRRRYKDPMTGKDEWRTVHVDSAGQLTDSVVQKQANQQKKEVVAEFVSVLPGVGSTAGTGGQAGQNVALRKRPSETGGATDGSNSNSPYPVFDPNAPVNISQMTGNNAQGGQNPQQQPPQGQQPGVPGQAPPPAGAQNVPGQPPDPNQPQQQPGVNPQQAQTQQPQPQGMGQPPGMPGVTPGMPNANPSNVPPGVPGVPGGFPATAGAQQPTGQPGAAPNAGLDMINKILTTPRAAVGGNVPGAPGLQIGGGIAGFASTMESPSIKVYNERQKYNEWEFIYDMRKDKRLTGAANAAAAGAMNNNPLGGKPPTVSGPGATQQQIPNPLMNPNQQTTNPNLFGGPQGPQGPQSPNYSQPGRR
jgi:hypothetical protein